MSTDSHRMEETGDWFRREREQRALREAFISAYRDEEPCGIFYGLDTFDPIYCGHCAETTEIVEEVRVRLVETPERELVAEVDRMKTPRILCRECLSFLEIE